MGRWKAGASAKQRRGRQDPRKAWKAQLATAEPLLAQVVLLMAKTTSTQRKRSSRTSGMISQVRSSGAGGEEYEHYDENSEPVSAEEGADGVTPDEMEVMMEETEGTEETEEIARAKTCCAVLMRVMIMAMDVGITYRRDIKLRQHKKVFRIVCRN